jgi:hypothetical protein
VAALKARVSTNTNLILGFDLGCVPSDLGLSHSYLCDHCMSGGARVSKSSKIQHALIEADCTIAISRFRVSGLEDVTAPLSPFEQTRGGRKLSV